MRLTDLNRAGGIGSNSLLLEIGPFRLVLDCGLHPKIAGRETLPALDLVEPGSLDAIILTHCHLDHLGGLPILGRAQPQAPILLSVPSLTLAPRMLHNSVNVMGRQREELGLAEYPLYTHAEINRLEKQLFALPFGQTRTLRHDNGEKLEITLHPAGHVAGAAGVTLRYKHRTIFFTGDCLFDSLRTLGGAKFPTSEVDTLVIETTRGATPRESSWSRAGETDRLLQSIGRTLAAKGRVLLPVFALGRMQEVLTVLCEARRQGRLPKVPVYCAGLGVDLAHYLDEISRKTGLVDFRRKVLKELGIRALPTLRPGRAPEEAALYVLSSGMMVEHTPSYHAAAALLGDSANSVHFVGYCDPDTPGGKLLATPEGQTFLFETLDYATPVRARVERFDLSGHAGRDELLAFARQRNPRAVVLTHGDPEARDWFAEQLMEDDRRRKVYNPAACQAIEV